MSAARDDRYPLLKIHGSIASFGSAERRLAEFILDNPRRTIDATIEELAQLSGSSYATISRFCRKMGYSGFREFRSALIDDIVTQQRDELNPSDLALVPGLTAAETIERVCRFSERTLHDTERFLDPAALASATEAILAAPHVLLVGAGTSAITARYAYTRFFRVGVACTAEPDPVVFQMRAATMGRGDVLVAVSSSGRTAAVVDAARAAREAGATVVSISDYAISPLNREADVLLYTTPRTASIFADTDMPLVLGQILIVDALFGMLVAKSAPEAESVYRRAQDAADRSKLRDRT